MVRPRAGDFVPSPSEIDVMEAEIAGLKRTRVAGVVLGALTSDGRVDVAVTARLTAAARPMSVTFHRAFDEVLDQAAALEDLVRLGIDRVLTSGGAPDAFLGRAAIRRLVEQARGRIIVLAGGGIRPGNVEAILAETGVVEVHGSVPFRIPEHPRSPPKPSSGELPGRLG